MPAPNFKPPKPIRDAKHLENIKRCCCVIDGSTRGIEVHHLLRTPEKAMGRRSGDNWGIPMHWPNHRVLHATGDETAYFESFGLNGPDMASKFWSLKDDLEEMQRFARRMAEVARRAGR